MMRERRPSPREPRRSEARGLFLLLACGLVAACARPEIQLRTADKLEYEGELRTALYMRTGDNVVLAIDAMQPARLFHSRADDDSYRRALILLSLGGTQESTRFSCDRDCGALILQSPVGHGSYKVTSASVEADFRSSSGWISGRATIELPGATASEGPVVAELDMKRLAVRDARTADELEAIVPKPIAKEPPVSHWMELLRK